MLAKELGLCNEERDLLAAQAVALTHGNRETFLSGAFIAHFLGLILEDPKADIEDMLEETISAISLQFGGEFPQISNIWELLQLARTLAITRSVSPSEAMERLGCQTGPEVLAGVIYTLLTCEQDFDGAMITAVNHSGRSAAVGALTGALLGAILGLEALPEFYLESLEAGATLTELSYDMRHSDSISNIVNIFDDEWDRKYLHGGL
jgi:ADP-ribosylglycohydrolase